MIEHADRVCDRFEAAWQAGGRPPIEAYLEDPRTDREGFLFEHLLLREPDYRRRRGESPPAAEYLARFPQYAAVIAPVYADAAAGEALADTPTRDTATLQRLPEAEFGQPCTLRPGTKLGKYELLEERRSSSAAPGRDRRRNPPGRCDREARGPTVPPRLPWDAGTEFLPNQR